MVWYFIGVYIINRTLQGRLEIRNFFSHVEKNISTLKEKFRIPVRPCNIPYIEPYHTPHQPPHQQDQVILLLTKAQ